MNNGHSNGGYSIFNWQSNPFTFKILPELLTGYQTEIGKITSGLQNGVKFSLLLGPTGSGKTTLLKHIIPRFGQQTLVIYLPKPPTDPKDFVEIFKAHLGTSFMERLFQKSSLNLYNLTEYLNDKLRGRKCVVLIDECHESSIHTLEWIRTLTDQVDNMSVLFSGLPTFEKMLNENLETLMRRMSLNLTLGNLSKSETKDLIKRRIEFVGGDDTKPFTFSTIDAIYEKTGGFPRDIIKICDEIAQRAISKNITLVDTDFLEEEERSFQRTSSETIESIPYRQKIILDALAKHKSLTPSEVAEKIDSKEYKNKDNAIRSINNLLKRLMRDGLVIRKKKGKAYKYEISAKIKPVMVSS